MSFDWLKAMFLYGKHGNDHAIKYTPSWTVCSRIRTFIKKATLIKKAISTLHSFTFFPCEVWDNSK